MAGLVPRIIRFTQSFVYFDLVFHILQSSIHATLGEKFMVHNGWYPFDTTITYVFILVTIKQVMEELENNWNACLLGEFLAIEMCLCLVAFSIITSWGNYLDELQAFFAYVLATAWISVLCGFGNELTDQAQSVADAAFGCDWIGTSKSFQRSIGFIIARANKDFVLTAGKFVPASNKTLMSMMNESFSLFMFLMHVRDTTADN